MASNGDLKSETANVEYEPAAAPVAKPTFFQKVLAHFKKWWWAHLIVFIICLLVIVLPVVYVGYPRIARNIVKKARLEISELQALAPTADSIHMVETQTLRTNSSYHSKFYSFQANASLAGEEPYGEITNPEFHAKDGLVFHLDQHLQFSNVSAYAEFSKAFVMEETFYLNVYAKPHLKEGGLPKISATFNKTIPLTGLSGLKGFNVTDFQIVLSGLPDGHNMNGTVYIPNPSIITIELGNLTMSLAVEGTPIGNSYLNDVTLRPGDNYFYMESATNVSTVLPMISGDNATYKDGLLPVSITTESVIHSGVHLSYYEYAMAAAAPKNISLNVGAALKKLEASLNSGSS